MPWAIHNFDRVSLHLRDPRKPIHLTLDGRYMKVWIGADTEKASRLSLIWDYRTPSIETVNKGCGHIDIVILGTILESLGLSREQRAPILTPLWQQLSKDNSNIGAHNV